MDRSPPFAPACPESRNSGADLPGRVESSIPERSLPNALTAPGALILIILPCHAAPTRPGVCASRQDEYPGFSEVAHWFRARASPRLALAESAGRDVRASHSCAVAVAPT